jgi:hypothetical protein
MCIIATTSHRCNNVYKYAGWVSMKVDLEITLELYISADAYFTVGMWSII